MQRKSQEAHKVSKFFQGFPPNPKETLEFLAVCNVLSIILQANPPLGVYLITNGGIKRTAMQDKTQDAKNKKPPPILKALVLNAGEDDSTLKRASLSVLALASQVIIPQFELANILPFLIGPRYTGERGKGEHLVNVS